MTTYTALWRARTRDAESSDSGMALVVVLGIMLVGGIIAVTLAMVTMYNSTYTLRNSAAMHAYQSADLGIDMTWERMASKVYSELDTECATAPSSLTIDNDTVVIERTYAVKTASGETERTCPLDSDVIQGVTLRATSTTAPVLGNDGPVTKTVEAQFMPVPEPATLDKAIFSEGFVLIDNSSEIGVADAEFNADVYSNGNVECKTPGVIRGDLIAYGSATEAGNVYFANPCHVYGDVMASGYVDFASNAVVDGDVYAYSSASGPNNGDNAIRMPNSNAWIKGNALTNGGIFSEARGNKGGIDGFALARAGSYTTRNQAEVSGDLYVGGTAYLDKAEVGRNAYFKSTVTHNNGATIQGDMWTTSTPASQITVKGVKHVVGSVNFPNTSSPALVERVPGYTFQYIRDNGVPKPVREQLPMFTVNDGSGGTVDDVSLWETLGYDVERYTGVCNDSSSTKPATVLANSTGRSRLIIFEGCTGPVTFRGATAHLTGNVAMVSKTGFEQGNSKFTITTDSPTGTYLMHWIVPSDSVPWTSSVINGTTFYSPSCPTTNSPDINMENNVQIDEVRTLFYTPCKFEQRNWSDKLVGQIYAGKVTVNNSFDLEKAEIPVPSASDVDPEPGDEVVLGLLARFDD